MKKKNCYNSPHKSEESHRFSVHPSLDLPDSRRRKASLEVRLHLVSGYASVGAVDTATLVRRDAVAAAEKGIGYIPRQVKAVPQADLMKGRGGGTERAQNKRNSQAYS